MNAIYCIRCRLCRSNIKRVLGTQATEQINNNYITLMHYHYSLVMLISNVRIRSKSGYRISSKLHDEWWRFHVLVITRPFRLKTHSDAKDVGGITRQRRATTATQLYSATGAVTSCRRPQARNIHFISLPEQPDCKRPLVVAAISAYRSV